MEESDGNKNIIKTAQETILTEAEAIRKLASLVDTDFEDAVHTILNSEGRVIVTGIGKSANIANKIVATMNSTGTPAIFMHAADAIHEAVKDHPTEECPYCEKNRND